MISITVIDNTNAFLAELIEAKARSLEKCGYKAEKYAKDDCPVDTGKLRDSITHTVDNDAVTIGTPVAYASYVEFGTRKMHARPYLRPAIENHISEYNQIIENELRK